MGILIKKKSWEHINQRTIKWKWSCWEEKHWFREQFKKNSSLEEELQERMEKVTQDQELIFAGDINGW